jgi:hypothetical protein
MALAKGSAQEVDPRFVLNGVAAGRHMRQNVASQLEEETAECMVCSENH